MRHVKQIANDLNVTEDEVISMNRRMTGGDASLNARIGDGEDGAAEWQDWLEDETANQAADYERSEELEKRRALMIEAMEVLNDREKDILAKRRLQTKAMTLEELSEVYNVSRERIRQIEVRAFEKLQERMREMAKESGMLESA